MADETQSLRELRADFLRTSTPSMPVAGLIVWSALGVSALVVSARLSGMLALYVMTMILPVAFLLERLRGRTLFAGGAANPLVRLLLASIAGIGVTVAPAAYRITAVCGVVALAYLYSIVRMKRPPTAAA